MKTRRSGWAAIGRMAAVVCFLPAIFQAFADIPSIKDVIRDEAKINAARLEKENASVIEQAAEEIWRTYDKQHSNDLQLEFLSPNNLQRLATQRSNDFAPQLMLVPRDLKNDEDCTQWFATFKQSYALATNDTLRDITVSLASIPIFQLEAQSFGRGMLKEMKQWLDKLPPGETAAFAMKVRLLNLFTALCLEDYENVPRYSTGTPFRTLAPLWMMSKGKWETALKEVRRLKNLDNLDQDEKRTLDKFEEILTGLVEKKSAK